MDRQHTLPRHMDRHLATCSPPQDSSTAHNTPHIPSHYYTTKQTFPNPPNPNLSNCPPFKFPPLNSNKTPPNRRKHKHNYATTCNSNSKHEFTSTSEHTLHHPSPPARFE